MRYNENERQRIAGNDFGYCNRLRVSDFMALFQQLNLKVERYETDVDQESLFYLQRNDISLDQQFISYVPEDICTTSLKILMREHTNHTPPEKPVV